jgi:outer membrane protein OmpA-like peptidoglycan-associated protein
MKTTLLFGLIVFVINISTAQIDVDKIKEKAGKKVEKQVDKQVDKVLDNTEKKIEDKVSKKDNDQNSENAENNADDNETTVQNVPDGNPQLVSYTKYDFVPGDQLLFFEDFTQDAVGDFPAMWTTTGSGEVRTLNNYPGNWLYMSSEQNVYCLMKDLLLPENFIFEFDLIAPRTEDDPYPGLYLTFYKSSEDWLIEDLLPGDPGFHVNINTGGWDAQGYMNQEYLTGSKSELAPIPTDKSTHIIIWVQKRRLRVYHQGQKIIDGPTTLPANASYNRLRFSEWGFSSHCYITNLKITTAAPDTRSKLLTEGKLISYGIYFDSGKDVVKAESYGALNDIAKVLKENADVKITIVGHTDSDGDNAANLDLSKRRAASVKNSLVKDFGIDAGRIETDGKGETAAIAANDTPENKAKNRRVEFIKK